MTSATDNFDWLEGQPHGGALKRSHKAEQQPEPGEVVPVHWATKADVAAVIGLTLVQVDRLVRDGAPVARRGASRKEGLRFDLPRFIEWYIGKQVERRATAGDGLASAKERAAANLATMRDLDIAERQKKLVPTALVQTYLETLVSKFKGAVLQLPTQLSLDAACREELDGAVHSLLADLAGGQSEFERKNELPAPTPEERAEARAELDRLYDMNAVQDVDDGDKGNADSEEDFEVMSDDQTKDDEAEGRQQLTLFSHDR